MEQGSNKDGNKYWPVIYNSRCVQDDLILAQPIEGAKRSVTCNFESAYICGYDLAPHNFDGLVWEWKNDGKFVKEDGTRAIGKQYIYWGLIIDWIVL